MSFTNLFSGHGGPITSASDSVAASTPASAPIVLSRRAYADLLNETSQHPLTETGGVFLGVVEHGVWYVVESIDPGPRALLRHSYFEYDQAYVTHLANKVSRRYASPLRLVGLWHRHPGSFDRFSFTDDQTHLRYLRQCAGPVVSILVNIDPVLRLTCYIVDGPPVSHHRVVHMVSDNAFPPGLLDPIDHEALLAKIHATSVQAAVAPHAVTIVDCDRSDAGGHAANRHEDLLDVLDSEMEFLESQHDFSYELVMTASGLLLTLRRLSALAKDDKPLEFVFTTQDHVRRVLFEDTSYGFREGIVKRLVRERCY